MVGRERRAPDAARRVRPGRRRSLVPALHRARRRRRRQVALRRRGDRLADGAATVAAAAAFPTATGSDLVATRRSAGRDRDCSSGWPRTSRAGHRARPSCSSRTGEPVAPEEAFWAVRRVARDPRARSAARPGRRRPALGRADVHGLPGARDRLGRATRRCCCWSWRVPRCSTAGRAGAPGGRTRPRCCWRRWPRRTRPTCCASCWARRGSAPTRPARILDVAEGNPLFVVEVVEMLIDDDVLPAGDGHARRSS